MTADPPDAALTIVGRYAGGTDWEVRPIDTGGGGTAFRAETADRRLFVKWPTEIRPLPRLAELGVIPPVVATGQFEGAPFLLQQWIDARTADRGWLRTHAGEVAAMMRTYQDDAAVRRSLSSGREMNAEGARLDDLSRLDAAVRAASGPEFREGATVQAIRRFLRHGDSVPSNGLVATHGDPNPQNFLITKDAVLLIDWDGAALSDPLRDLAPLLWWFLPPPEWAAVLARHGGVPLADRRAAQWWAARASLLIAVWLDAHTADRGRTASFLRDFLAAESGSPNPRLANPG